MGRKAVGVCVLAYGEWVKLQRHPNGGDVTLKILFDIIITGAFVMVFMLIAVCCAIFCSVVGYKREKD